MQVLYNNINYPTNMIDIISCIKILITYWEINLFSNFFYKSYPEKYIFLQTHIFLVDILFQK